MRQEAKHEQHAVYKPHKKNPRNIFDKKKSLFTS